MLEAGDTALPSSPRKATCRFDVFAEGSRLERLDKDYAQGEPRGWHLARQGRDGTRPPSSRVGSSITAHFLSSMQRTVSSWSFPPNNSTV